MEEKKPEEQQAIPANNGLIVLFEDVLKHPIKYPTLIAIYALLVLSILVVSPPMVWRYLVAIALCVSIGMFGGIALPMVTIVITLLWFLIPALHEWEDKNVFLSKILINLHELFFRPVLRLICYLVLPEMMATGLIG